MSLCDSCVYESVCLCVYMFSYVLPLDPFFLSFVFFLWFVLFQFICFHFIIVIFKIPAFLIPRRDRNGVYLGGRGDGEDLRGVEGVEP